MSREMPLLAHRKPMNVKVGLPEDIAMPLPLLKFCFVDPWFKVFGIFKFKFEVQGRWFLLSLQVLIIIFGVILICGIENGKQITAKAPPLHLAISATTPLLRTCHLSLFQWNNPEINGEVVNYLLSVTLLLFIIVNDFLNRSD